MEISPGIRKGKQYFQYLSAFVIALALANTVYEIIFGLSYVILAVQGVLMAITLLIPFSLMNGRKQKNLFFAFLFFSGIFAFYQAGARMPDMRKTEITFPPVATLCVGIGFIFAGIYLSYSPEISAFLHTVQAKRAKLQKSNL